MRRGAILVLFVALAATSAFAWGASSTGGSPEPAKPATAAKPSPAKPAATAAAAEDGESVLKAKGLTKVNGVYLLEFDAKLYPNLASLRAAKAKVTESTHMRVIAARDVRNSRRLEEQLADEYEDVHAKLARAKDPSNHNQWVKPNNDALDRLRAQVRTTDAMQKKLATVPDYSKGYEDALGDTSARMEETAARYAELARDPQVSAALAAASKPGAPVKLGPSVQFTRELAGIRKEAAIVKPDAIKFEPHGGTAVVPVTINGKVLTPMIVDSGASMVCLTEDVADSLGLKPGPGDKTIKTTIANGQTVEARRVMLKSLTLGRYTVNDVEAVILGKGDRADCLLGATFLENFVYRMDLTAGLLHLQPLPGGGVVVAGGGGASAATTKPSGGAAAGDVFRARATEVPWSQGAAAARVIGRRFGFAVLAGVGGRFEGYGEAVRLGLTGNRESDDAQDWALSGDSHQDGVRATAIALMRDGKGPFKADLTQYEWRNGQPRARMIAKSEGFCFLSGINGHFEGAGEAVWISLEADGYYYLNGRSGQGQLGATATALRPEGYAQRFSQEPTEVQWRTGQPGVRIMPVSEGFCYLTSLGGALRGVDQEVGLRIGEDGNWYLDGDGGKRNLGMAVKAMAVKYLAGTNR